MNNSFFVIYGALMAQPQIDPSQMAQSQGAGGGLSQELAAYTLPSGRVSGSDMPRVQSIMEKALQKVSDALKPGEGSYADLDTVKSAIFSFIEWLNGQGCVSNATTTYEIETTDKYAENIFTVYPGQLPLDIVFNMGGDVNPQYRLLIFVSRVDLLSFGNLMENTSLAGVPVPANWPSGYLDKRP